MTRFRPLAIIMLVACAGVFAFDTDSSGQIRRPGIGSTPRRVVPAPGQTVSPPPSGPQCTGLGGAGVAATEYIWLRPADFGRGDPWLQNENLGNVLSWDTASVPLPSGVTIREIWAPVIDAAPNGHVTISLQDKRWYDNAGHLEWGYLPAHELQVGAQCATAEGKIVEAKGLNHQISAHGAPMLFVNFHGPAAAGQLKVGGIRIGYTR